MSKNAGYLIQEILSAAQIDHIWGITGDSANFITEAVCTNNIRFMHVRHEESAGFAAGTESLMKKRITACIGSCGPGTLHLLNGLYDANKNGASVLCLATQIPKDEIGTRYVQETDPMRLFRDCSVFCEYVQSVDQIPRVLGIAMQAAISQKGVSVVVIPGDISSAGVPHKFDLNYIPHYTNPVVLPGTKELTGFARMLNSAKQITIVAEPACTKEAEAIKKLSIQLKAPCIWNLQSKELLEHNNPFPAGCMDAFCKTYSSVAINDADLILLMGLRNLPEEPFEAKAKVIQLDSKTDFSQQNHWADLLLMGTISDTIDAVMPFLDDQPDTDFADRVVNDYLKKQEDWNEIAKSATNDQQQITPEYVLAQINEKSPDDACFTLDTGTSVVLAGAYIRATDSRKFFQSSVYGSAGNALPMAMGVAAAVTNRTVIAICGDGGLAMLLGDLLTVSQMNLDIKILVLNNGSYEMPAVNMLMQNREPVDTSFNKTNFAEIATELGIASQHVEAPQDLLPAIDKWLQTQGAALLDVSVAHAKDLSLFLSESH